MGYFTNYPTFQNFNQNVPPLKLLTKKDAKTNESKYEVGGEKEKWGSHRNNLLIILGGHLLIENLKR